MEEGLGKSIEERIKDSIAAKSMLDEIQISAKLKELDWSVTDNPYYEDRESGKFRELDVFGRFRLELKNKSLFYDIQLLVESKSINNYHIILSNADRFISSDLDVDWPGHHFYSKSAILDVLKRLEFNKSEIDALFNKVREFSYPNDSWIYGEFQYSFFSKLESFYSFRETNLGSVKDLNNSVVWKAFQELVAVNAYIRKRHLDNMLGDIEYYIEKKEAETKVDSAFMAIQHYLGTINYIHPVLVIDGSLWSLDQANNVSALNYARILQTDLYGSNYFWIDVVNRQHFNEYITLVTDHTKQSITQLKKKAT